MFHSWQKFLDSAVNDYIQKSGYEQFCKAETSEEQVKNVIDNNIVCVEWLDEYFRNIPCKNNTYKKNKTVADKYREDGNRHFKKHHDDKALAAYNECVVYAPLTEETGRDSSLALGLANRSAVLFHLRQYKECVEDIERALDVGYPTHLEHKLWMRKAQCLFHLKDTTLAQEALERTREKIHLAKDVTNDKKEDLEANVALWIQKIHSDSNHVNNGDHHEKCQFLLPELRFGPGALLRQASAGLTVHVTPEKGRHIVAVKAIKAGDTLIRERPYAAVLLPDHYETHCHHCYGKLSVCTPCRRCSRVRYCNSTCRNQSWNSYHWLECHFLDLLHSVGIAHLSLRVILVTGIQQILEMRKTTSTLSRNESSDPILGVNSQGTYDRDYTAVYHLMPHSEHMPKEDLLQYTLTAVLLLRCLREGGFFRRDIVNNRSPVKRVETDLLNRTTNLSLNSGGVEVDAINEFMQNDVNLCKTSVEELVGALLLRHICQLICNAHAITELQVTHVDASCLVNPQSQVRIATAIYPTTSLCNHACEPSFINSFHKDTLIVRSVKDIAPGEEISNCYGPQYRRMTRSERRQLLRDQYFFDCHCESCEEGEQMEQRHQVSRVANTALRCPQCSGAVGALPEAICLDCGTPVEDTAACLKQVMSASDLFVRGLELMESEDIADAVEVLRKCLKIRRAVCYRHHRDVAETHDALARCYATYGDFTRSAEHLAGSVTTTEVIYGSKSIELANELHKFAEVLVQGRQLPRASAVTRKALDIFVLHYGNQHPTVTELIQLQQHIRNL